MTSGIGLPYINIAVAESAVRLARSFDVILCKLQVRANANIVRLANGLVSSQKRLAFTTPIHTGRLEYSSFSRKSADPRIVQLKERLALVEQFVASLSTLSFARGMLIYMQK